MSLDSNCQRDLSGRILPYYSPRPPPASQGVNAFAQSIPLGHDIYVYPPFVDFLDQIFHGAITLVVLDCVQGVSGGLSFSLLLSIGFC